MAPALGAGYRWFESIHPDLELKSVFSSFFVKKIEAIFNLFLLFYNTNVKKLSFFLLLSLLSFFIMADAFPSYDFTFYESKDNSLTSLNKENIGIDITGYGFMGKTTTKGLYLRIGIQTPFSTLIQLRDSIINDINERNSEKESESYNKKVTTITAPGAQIKEDSNYLVDKNKKNRDIEKMQDAEWKTLLTIGPAFRSLMGKNATVYCGLGLNGQSTYIRKYSPEKKESHSSLFVIMGLDIDAGFRVSLENSKTTIRIGVHFLSDIIGINKTTIISANTQNYSTYYDFYGYAMGKNGILTETSGCGYIRLALTINNKERISYTYSNKTRQVGNGEIIYLTD